MLEHQIKVLKSVSGNPELLKKELQKSMQWLNNKEQEQLIEWFKKNLMETHSDVLNEFLNSKFNFAS